MLWFEQSLRPNRVRASPFLWVTSRRQLRERITHPEHGLWKQGHVKSQKVLTTLREHQNLLYHKKYIVTFTKGLWSKHCAIVFLDSVVCYET